MLLPTSSSAPSGLKTPPPALVPSPAPVRSTLAWPSGMLSWVVLVAVIVLLSLLVGNWKNVRDLFAECRSWASCGGRKTAATLQREQHLVTVIERLPAPADPDLAPDSSSDEPRAPSSNSNPVVEEGPSEEGDAIEMELLLPVFSRRSENQRSVPFW
ncbi:hypothetical protein OHC33_007297 [Knufia fluminis]|uniref:Uncharacterized protein n=1 Tax=Knufia fluminis TaxID=191047 RepID=A0AAN8EC18_9EURO|nr:hypothetical protein OHC33_007297 [Knufia fluminis]